MSELWQQIVASCSGALITAVLMTPLDVVKIRLQAQSKGFAKGECFLYCNGLMDHLCTCLNGNGTASPSMSQRNLWKPVRSTHLNGMLDAFVKIPRMEGIQTLWSGLPPTLVMAVPSTVVYFTCYDQMKYRLGFVDGEANSLIIPFLSGSLARAGAVTVITPLELVRTKIQSEQMTYKGWSPLMWRDVPFSAVYFTLYEAMKAWVLQYYNTKNITTVHSFCFGAISGMIAGMITLPFDVVKTHRQVELGTTAASSSGVSNSASTYQILKSLRRQSGIGSWFIGIGPRVLKVAPACAIMISSYEYCKQLFSSRRNAAESTHSPD